MVLPLEDLVWTDLGQILYLRLRGELSRGSQVAADLTSISETQQRLVLQGLRERAEPDLHLLERYSSDDKESPFSLLAALWKAGADIPIEGLRDVLRQPLKSDHFHHASHALKHLHWLERVAEDPTLESDEGYGRVYESFFEEDVRARRTEVSASPLLRPVVVQTSPPLQQPAQKIKDAAFFDQFIMTEVTAAQRYYAQEQDELGKYSYSSIRDQRKVFTHLDRARSIAALQQGKQEADRESLDDITFFDRLLPPTEAARWKQEFALRQALESPSLVSAKLLYDLSTTAEEADAMGKRLAERRVDMFDLGKMVEVSLQFLDKAAEIRRQRGQDAEEPLRVGKVFLADSIARRGNIKRAQEFYQQLGLVAESDDATFRTQVVRVADELVAAITPNNYNERDKARTALNLYKAGYPSLSEMPLEKIETFLSRARVLDISDRDAFFTAAYGDRLPQSVAESLGEELLKNGKLDRAIELYARARKKVSPDMMVDAAKGMLRYHGLEEKIALDYFNNAIAQGHPKVTFHEFFEAYDANQIFLGDEDRSKHPLRNVALKLALFAGVLDLTTDAYDYHQPTDTSYVPSTFTDLAFHYAVHGTTENSETMSLDDVLRLGKAFHRNVDSHILSKVSSLVQKENRHVRDFVQQLDISKHKEYDQAPVLFEEEKARLYPLAVHRALENLLDFGSDRISLSDDIIFFLQERTRLAQQVARVPVHIKDTKKEDDERALREHYCHYPDGIFPSGWPGSSSHTLIKAVQALPAPEAVAIQDDLYLNVAGRLARRTLSTLEALVKPTEGASNELQRDYQTQTYFVHSLGSLALRVVRDITTLPAAPTGDVIDATAVSTYRIAKGNLESIAKVGEAFMAGRIEHDNGFELGWYLLQRSGLPISDSVKDIVRARYETLRKHGDVTHARQEAQRIGEFTQDKALMLARRALRSADIKTANELYGMYREWNAIYTSGEPETAIPRSMFAELFHHIPVRVGLGKVHIHPGEVNAVADELLAEGNALGVVRLEKALDEAGLVVHDGSPSAPSQKIRIDGGKFLPVIQRYLEQGNWRSLAELHEQRSDLNISQKVWAHYRGQLPDVATMSDENLRHAAKIMPTHFRLPETVEAVVARAEAGGSRYLAEDVLGPEAMSTSQWYDAIFCREFNADRVGQGFQFTTYDKTIATARKVLDDQEFLRQKVGEGDERELRQLAYAALQIRYNASENVPLQEIIASQRPFLASIIGEILGHQTSDRIGSGIEYHNGRQEVVATIAGIAAYLGDELLPQFLATNFPNIAPEPRPSGYSGGTFSGNETLRAA